MISWPMVAGLLIAGAVLLYLVVRPLVVRPARAVADRRPRPAGQPVEAAEALTDGTPSTR